jgi:hypothetical protein
MSFESLIDKVHQSEQALEAKERQTAADWRQCKASWRGLWTPTRLIAVGMVSGFIVGKVEPAKHAVKGGGALQLLSAVAGLFAGGSAQAAAGHAMNAADKARQTTAAVENGADAAPAAPVAPRPPEPGLHTPESLRAAGLL